MLTVLHGLVLAVAHLRAPLPRCVAVPRAAVATLQMSASVEESPTVIKHENPLPTLSPKEVISNVMAALHRSNWDSPSPHYGFEIALRFFAPTHQAKLLNAKPAGFARFMQRPHKKAQIMWNEFKFDGDTVLLTSDEGVSEAYVTISLRSAPTDDWKTSRWKLVQIEFDYGTSVMPAVWLVEHIFVAEPDTPEDIEYLRAKAAKEPAFLNWNGEIVPLESPRQVVDKVMKALRYMDEPYPLHGASVATRYCSPRNRASELSPAVFASYMEEPFYQILSEWDEIEWDEDDEDGDEDGDAPAGAAASKEYEVLVKRESDDSFSMVTWELSLYDGQWLIDSMRVI